MSDPQNWVVRIASFEDFPAMRELLLKSYGGTYPFPERLDTGAMARAMAEGATVCGIAVTDDGAVIGHAALEQRGPYGLWEYDRAIVDESFRASGVFSALGKLLVLERGRREKARFVMGQVVTSHLYAQRFGRSLGFVTTGLLLGCVPHTMVVAGLEPQRQPISEVVMVIRISKTEAPRELTLSGSDRDRALGALASLELSARPGRGRRGTLGAHFERNKAFGLVHLRFGAQAPPRRLHEGFIEGLEAAGTRVVWADVPVDHEDAPRVVERLRKLRLGYSAYVPAAGVHGEDVVRFQRYLDPTPLRPESIHVIDEARSIAEAVFADCLEAGMVGAS